MPIRLVSTFRTEAVGALYRYFMITAAVVATGLLGGCGALTRVDMATYQSEYAQLYPMGMDHALALKKIEAAGYSCEEPYASGTLMDNGSEVPVKFQHCSRASREMMCPQRRYMRFKFRTSDNKVIQVDEPRMEEKSCF